MSKQKPKEEPEAPDYRESEVFADFVSDVEFFIKTRSTRKRIVTWRILRENFEKHSYVCRRCFHQKIGEAVEKSNHLRIVAGKHCEVIQYSEKPVIEVFKQEKSLTWTGSFSNKVKIADLGIY